MIFNNRTTLQQLNWEALRGLIVSFVTPKNMASFCTTLYQAMSARYPVGKKSQLSRLPAITPETQLKQWPVFYEFLITLCRIYSELFCWVQESVHWGATPFDIEWAGSSKASVKPTIKAIIDAHNNAYLKGLYAQVEISSAGNQSSLTPHLGDDLPFDYVVPKLKKQTPIFSASQFIDAMIEQGRNDTAAAKQWKNSQSKTFQPSFKDFDSDDGENNLNELSSNYYDDDESDAEQGNTSADEISLAELWSKGRNVIKGKNWDDVCWCLIFGDVCKGNCRPKSKDPDLDRAKASVYLLWQANKRLEYAQQHKKKIEEYQNKIKPVLSKRNQKIDWVWHEDQTAESYVKKPLREPPIVPKRKKQYDFIEAEEDETEENEFSALTKEGF
jgi:hypothetical protein